MVKKAAISVSILNKFLINSNLKTKKLIRLKKNQVDTPYHDLKNVSMDALQKWSGLATNKVKTKTIIE